VFLNYSPPPPEGDGGSAQAVIPGWAKPAAAAPPRAGLPQGNRHGPSGLFRQRLQM